MHNIEEAFTSNRRTDAAVHASVMISIAYVTRAAAHLLDKCHNADIGLKSMFMSICTSWSADRAAASGVQKRNQVPCSSVTFVANMASCRKPV